MIRVFWLIETSPSESFAHHINTSANSGRGNRYSFLHAVDNRSLKSFRDEILPHVQTTKPHTLEHARWRLPHSPSFAPVLRQRIPHARKYAFEGLKLKRNLADLNRAALRPPSFTVRMDGGRVLGAYLVATGCSK